MELLVLLSIFLVPLWVYLHDRAVYKKSNYFLITKNSYHTVRYNKGVSGEYKTYTSLQYLEKSGAKFLFNLYLPAVNSQTTEIDVLLISLKGLFVFESKNYDGWIFGNEMHKNWTQTLPRGRGGGSHKSQFYNPIMQNASHVRHLRRVIGEEIPTKSIIVFSDACTLKNVTVKSSGVSVINRRFVAAEVNKMFEQMPIDFLTQTQVDSLFYRLHPYTQVDYTVKRMHVKNLGGNI